ncbi:MAG: hypothetical protein ACR2NV_05980, partial [Thermoleophilaceae bacterium]
MGARVPSGTFGRRGGREPARGAPALQRHHLGALLTEAAPATRRSEARAADFFAAKGIVEAVLATVGVAWEAAPLE